MSPRSQDIEDSATPAVKDLRNLFEQKARESPAKFPNGSPRASDTSVLLGPRLSGSRRPSPTPYFDEQPESLTPSPEPSTPDQSSSMRKRPPPPPPSRGQKPQIGLPSPTNSPPFRATLLVEPGNAPGDWSPPSIKHRLATRPPPPVPDLRPDRTTDAEPNFDTKGNVDKSPRALG